MSANIQLCAKLYCLWFAYNYKETRVTKYCDQICIIVSTNQPHRDLMGLVWNNSHDLL